MFAVLLSQSVGSVVLSWAFALSFYKKRICGWFGNSCLRYFNIQKTLHFVVITCCVCLWARFWLRDVGCLLWLFVWLFVWLILRLILRLIDKIVCRVCFDGLFFGCFWLNGCGDCFFWLFDFIDCSGWLFFVERLWFCEKEEKLWSAGALQRCFC